MGGHSHQPPGTPQGRRVPPAALPLQTAALSQPPRLHPTPQGASGGSFLSALLPTPPAPSFCNTLSHSHPFSPLHLPALLRTLTPSINLPLPAAFPSAFNHSLRSPAKKKATDKPARDPTSSPIISSPSRPQFPRELLTLPDSISPPPTHSSTHSNLASTCVTPQQWLSVA